MSRAFLSLLLVLAVGVGFATNAHAGAKLMINDNSELDLGIRIQPLVIYGDSDNDGDGSWDSDYDFKVRRARLRLKATIGEYVEGFIQTDVAGPAGNGQDARVIDAFVVVKPHQWFRFYTGLNMAPILRQNLTSSGALMAMDRPGIAYKSLTWGNRAVGRMANSTLSATDSGLRGGSGVRDEGITLFGSGALGEGNASLKYYAGIYDGINAAGETDPRFTGRVQVNFFDAEGGYYNLSTYLGSKKTVGIGAAFDTQSAVAIDDEDALVDYSAFTVDGFIEWPLGDGSLTAEGGWQMLDLGDAVVDGDDWRAVQGSGFYGQAGYFFAEHWQPWAEYEMWSSDADDVDGNTPGNYNALRVGITYYIEGHNANIKVGYEMLSSDTPLTFDTANPSNFEDSQNTFILGTYITY